MAHSAAVAAPAAAPKAAPVAQPAGAMRMPMLVFGVVEVRRLKRELEALEEYMAQAKIREPGKQPALPRVSRLLDALATDNRLNLLQPNDRQTVKKFLEDTQQHAPVIHMSFATDPSSAFTAKIVTWLRASIAPNALLEIGLQPNLAAGAVLRTNNKLFDLSLRERFADAQKLLIDALEKETAPAPATAQPAVAAVPQTPVPGPAQPQAATAPVPAEQPTNGGVAQ